MHVAYFAPPDPSVLFTDKNNNFCGVQFLPVVARSWMEGAGPAGKKKGKKSADPLNKRRRGNDGEALGEVGGAEGAAGAVSLGPQTAEEAAEERRAERRAKALDDVDRVVHFVVFGCPLCRKLGVGP